MKKLVFIGGPGSGKSTLATDVFTILKKQKYNTELVTEFIRRDIQEHGPMETIWEQYRVRYKQCELEDNLPDVLDYAVIDAGTISQYFYAILYCDHSNSRQRLVLADLYKYWLDDIYLKRYDYVFYVPSNHTHSENPNILNDGTRYQTTEEVNTLEASMNLMFDNLHKNVGNIYTIDVPLQERTSKVLSILGVE